MVADLLAREIQDPKGAAPHEKLSARESQILSLVCAGRSAKQIASDLSISVNTVYTYRARIAEKMGIQANSELIRYAFRHGLTE
jgi:DNA-binding NarL/FixJ family response regulator